MVNHSEDILKLEKQVKSLKKCCCANGGGTYCCYEEVTYAEAAAKIAANTLIKGKMYKITDRGDRGIFLEAISENQFNQEGSRLMLIPNNDAVILWNIWFAGEAYSIGDHTKRLGLVYINTSGNNTGQPTELGTVDWTLIPKSSFENDEYEERWFGVIYNFAEDWISKQWDVYGNIVGIPEVSVSFDSPYNPADVTQWEYGGISSEVKMYNNDCAGGIIDNFPDASVDGFFYIHSNKTTGYIWENLISRDLSVVPGIVGNTAINIDHNVPADYSTCIAYNNIPGSISSNTCSSIYFNSNSGGITSNTNTLQIAFNNNSGYILGNSNTGAITSNSNLGNIEYNSNTGDISANSNISSIYNNSNLGVITANSNGGAIYDCDSTINPCDIISNINNGIISGTYAADVTDPIVNK